MKFIDLFAGIGGFRLALESLGGKCVFSSEIDKFAVQTYEANFGEKPHGDITKIYAKDIPDFDILCAGFPCQPFSQAGLRKGFNDHRGNLFDEIIRIAEVKRPRIMLLENVQGLVSSEIIYEIISKIQKLDYDTVWRVLKASDYGLPTLRPRVYIIAFNNEYGLNYGNGFNWPERRPLRFTMSHILKAPCEKEVGFTLRKGGKSSGINDRHNWDSYKMKDGSIRTLTIDEMKMMMGFPDNFKFPVSKTQAMKQIGNSVAIDVVKAIGKQIIKTINRVE